MHTREVVHVSEVVPDFVRQRSQSGNRDARSSSSKVFETHVSRDARDEARYETVDPRKTRVEYVSPKRVVRYNYTDVVRRYVTGDPAKDKMLTGKKPARKVMFT